MVGFASHCFMTLRMLSEILVTSMTLIPCLGRRNHSRTSPRGAVVVVGVEDVGAAYAHHVPFSRSDLASDGDAGAAAAGCMAQVATKRVASAARPELARHGPISLLESVIQLKFGQTSIALPGGASSAVASRPAHAPNRSSDRCTFASVSGGGSDQRAPPHHEQHRELQSDRAAGWCRRDAAYGGRRRRSLSGVAQLQAQSLRRARPRQEQRGRNEALCDSSLCAAERRLCHQPAAVLP